MFLGREPDALRRLSTEEGLHLTGPVGLENIGDICELIKGGVQSRPPIDGPLAEDDVPQRVVHALECGPWLGQPRRESIFESGPKRYGCRWQSIRSL